MNKLEFRVAFHTAYAVDQASAIPGSVIKGLMLDAARDLGLTEPWEVARAVFGGHRRDIGMDKNHDLEGTGAWSAGPTQPSPWAWSDVEFDGESGRRTRTRIRIDPDTGTVADGAIVQINEFGGQDLTGTFTIEQIAPISPGNIDGHLTILEATARTVTALGGDRRRGLGWVTVSRADKTANSPEAIKGLAKRLAELRTKVGQAS